MANITESSAFEETVHEIGTDEYAMGGPGGVVNSQPGTLASRTRFLKEQQEVSHTETGAHNVDEVKDELDEALVDAQFASDADIAEVKILRSFVGQPRATGVGTYQTTQGIVDDLKLLETQKAEGDLLQSEIILKTLGGIYQRVYGTTGDIYSGSNSLSGYTLVGDGGIFCKTTPVAADSNAVYMVGDIRKLIDIYNVQPVTTEKVIFPDAEDAYTLPRTDILYFRCTTNCVTDTDEFYVNGNTHGTLISWDGLSASQRRNYLVDSAQNMFLKSDDKIYQVQYTWVTEANKVSMEECGYTADPLDGMLYLSGEYFATPIFLVDRRNQGAFHPEFNPLGSGYFMFGDNPALDDRRFEVGNSNQLLADNRDFTAWTAATGVTVSGTSITGAGGEAETLTYTIAGAEDSTRYVFFVDVSKAALDEAARDLEIKISVEDVSDTELDSATVTVALSADMQTAAVSIETPAADTDHLVLHIGSGSSCDYAFEADYARCSEDTVTAATQYDIQATSTSANTFTLPGDQRADFPNGWDVTLSGTVSGSDSNDGDYTVVGTVFDGTNTVVSVSPGFTYNTGNTGSAESTLWHYVNYCYTNQSEGEGGETTGGILSGISGRFDGKYHDEIDADSISDQRIFLEARGGAMATLSAPLLSGIPSSANETDVVVLTISNYDVEQIYNMAITTGTVSRDGDTITWTMPEVESGSITATLSIYVTNDADEFSDVVVVELTVYNVPIVGDEGIAEPEFIEADFEVLENVTVTSGSMSVTDSSLTSKAVTLPYTQEEGDEDWAIAEVDLNVTIGDGSELPEGSSAGVNAHILAGTETEYLASEDIDLVIDEAATTASLIVATSTIDNLWVDGGIHNSIGITLSGATPIVEVLSVSSVTADGVTEYSITIPTQESVPTGAWKPAAILPPIPVSLDSGLTTLNTVVGTVATPYILVGDTAYTSTGTYLWTVPEGVTRISIVTVGGGAGGQGGSYQSGGGGALRYINNIVVSPGETLTCIVGRGGSGGDGDETRPYGLNGGQSSVSRSGGTLCSAAGGLRTGPGGSSGIGTGGNGGAGDYAGGGAGGYSGNGGGGGGGGDAGSAGSGGGGGGGGGGGLYDEDSVIGWLSGGDGGGVGIYGQAASGAGGTGGTSSPNASYGGDGGNGSSGGYGKGGQCGKYLVHFGYDPPHELYYDGGPGSNGAVRIIWPGDVRQFPTSSEDEVILYEGSDRKIRGRYTISLTIGGEVVQVPVNDVTITSNGGVELDTVTLSIPEQSSTPTEASFTGNQLTEEALVYDAELGRYTVQYEAIGLSDLGSIRQLKIGVSNIDVDTQVNGLVVDLWRSY